MHSDSAHCLCCSVKYLYTFVFKSDSQFHVRQYWCLTQRGLLCCLDFFLVFFFFSIFRDDVKTSRECLTNVIISKFHLTTSFCLEIHYIKLWSSALPNSEPVAVVHPKAWQCNQIKLSQILIYCFCVFLPSLFVIYVTAFYMLISSHCFFQVQFWVVRMNF